MIVDIHTHCFNDKLAEKALRKLADASNVRPYGLGRIGDIQDYVLKHAGVDYAVVLNVSTSPGYEHNVNNFSADIDMIDRIISFGSVHPDYEDIYGELKRIKDMGMIGIKLHPDYQGYHFDDKKAYPIYEACQDRSILSPDSAIRLLAPAIPVRGVRRSWDMLRRRLLRICSFSMANLIRSCSMVSCSASCSFFRATSTCFRKRTVRLEEINAATRKKRRRITSSWLEMEKVRTGSVKR